MQMFANRYSYAIAIVSLLFVLIFSQGCCLYEYRESEIRGDLQQQFKLLIEHAGSGGVDLSQDGKSLVYITPSDDQTTSSLWVYDIFSDKEDCIMSEFIAFQPKWSPDKSKIAFYRVDSLDNWNLLYLDVESRKLHEILVKGQIGGREDLSWSPEGNNIAITVGPENGSWLEIIDLQGKLIRVIKNREIQGLSDPCWSPDGKKIAFSGIEPLEWHSEYEGPNPYGLRRIWVVDLSTSAFNKVIPSSLFERFIKKSDFYDYAPRWSPDGQWIAYERRSLEIEAGISICVISADGKRNMEVVSGNYRAPISWTPDSKGLVFFGSKNGETGIWLAKLDLD